MVTPGFWVILFCTHIIHNPRLYPKSSRLSQIEDLENSGGQMSFNERASRACVRQKWKLFCIIVVSSPVSNIETSFMKLRSWDL